MGPGHGRSGQGASEDKGVYRQNAGDLEAIINRIFEISEAAGSVTRDTKELIDKINIILNKY